LSFLDELKRRNVIKVGIAYAVVGWLTAQIAEFATENFGAPEWVLKIFVVFLLLGFPFVLIFAWAFEMTPEGIKREKDVDRSQSITGQTGQKLNRMIIGVLAVAVVYLLVDKILLQKTPEPAPAGITTARTSEEPGVDDDLVAEDADHQSIAVLPFVNMSADADNEYFSDGISEELLNVLVKVSSLRVASRTSAFAYKGKEVAIGDIARELKVDHVLEGSVRKAGNTVRITAQLIDGRSDRHLWSETYERQLDDIFDIQEEISNAIVDALKVALNVDEREAVGRAQRPTENTVAYELYLQGRYRWRQRREANIRAAIDLFEQAVALDPEFAVAYEALAAAHASLSAWSDVSSDEALAKAGIYAEKALSLDPMLSEARAVIAESLAVQYRWGEMLEQYETAVRNAPNNPTVIQWFAEILHNLGYLELALETVLQAYELDPASPVLNNVITFIAISAQQGDLALKHSKITSDLGLALAATLNVTPLLIERGEIDRLIENYGWQEDEVPTCIRARKNPELKPQMLQEYLAIDLDDPEENADPRVVAFCLAFAGDPDAAMDILVSMTLQENWYVINRFWIHTEEVIQLRRSPRFKQMVSDMGLANFWRENGWPDLCRPVGEEDFECE
jgi:TolB-like protein